MIFLLFITATAFEPDFVFPLENVTVAQGRDATFTCVVNNLGGYRVSGESTTARVCIGFLRTIKNKFTVHIRIFLKQYDEYDERWLELIY